jgi:Primase C terminal 1 (PriCT-1)
LTDEVRPPALHCTVDPKKDERTVTPGRRNDTLFRECMKAARSCDDLDQLLDFARTRNAEYSPPLPDNEVVKVAQSAWGYEERGENWIGRGGRIVSFTIAMSIFLAAAHTDAFALLAILRRQHWAPVDFILSNAMANSLGWSLRRFRSARDYLVECGKLRCVHRAGGGPHDPPKFQLLERVQFRSPI